MRFRNLWCGAALLLAATTATAADPTMPRLATQPPSATLHGALQLSLADAIAMGLAPWHGRVWLGSDRMAEQALPPGMVLPQMIHGGPGRAGGGEELGGTLGLEFYMQRTALQGFRGVLEKRFGPPAAE